jgi:atypical dual specificity phosphatase
MERASETSQRTADSSARRPRGFAWIVPGQLGGLPRPGIIDDVDEDLRGLAALGVTLLITLEEQQTVDRAALAALGIESVHFPIPDMGAPGVGEATSLCARVQAWLETGHRVAYHCLAGHGRTGTMLACQLVCAGQSARNALEQVRAVNPRYVQSDAQVAFLKRLELSRSHPPARVTAAPISLDEESRETTKGRECH